MNPTSATKRWAGALLVFNGLWIFVPMIILGRAIDWPASLGFAPDVVLPLITAHAGEVKLGYFTYLLYSVLFFPMALLSMKAVQGERGFSPLALIGMGFAALSTLARTIGILRWLTVMPLLAADYAIEPSSVHLTVFKAINAYGGGIGEILGVGLFAGLWAVLWSIDVIRNKSLPRWWGIIGVLAGFLVMAPLVEAIGFDLGAGIIASTAGVQLWWLGLGLYLLLKRR